MRYLFSSFLIFVSIALFAMSIVIIIEADGKLFYTGREYPAKNAANAIAAGKEIPREGLVEILNATADQLQAEKERIKSIGQITKDAGWTILGVSIIQIVLGLFIILRRQSMGSSN